MKNLIARSILLLFLFACGTRGESKKNPMPGPEQAAMVSATNSVPAVVAKYRAAVQSFADSIFGKSRFNGSLLVAKDGQIIFENYYGFTNPRNRTDSITSNTPFHLASVSKTITATAVLKLWQDGKLDIHDPLTKYFPGFPSPGVTIKMLLNHRSGLPNYVHYMDKLGWDKRKFVSNQDVLDFLVARSKDIHPGPADRHFSYSNTNFALLALIIEKVSGLPYPQYLQREIFGPLGMKDTYVFTAADSARSLPSFFYSGRPYAFDFLDYVYGDKNVYSTVRDLFTFNEALENGKILNDAILDSAYTPYSFERPGIHNYGLGWRMFVLKNGKKLIYHNGWWHGNRTAFYRMHDEHAVIIALCNNDCKVVYSMKKLADLFGNYLQNGKGNNSGSEDELENSVVSNISIPVPAKDISHRTYKKKSDNHRSFAAKK